MTKKKDNVVPFPQPPLKYTVLEPRGFEPTTLTKEHVWGDVDASYNRINWGMIVARTDDICPIFKDKVPYKSVTVVCTQAQKEDLIYWLEYVHGGGCVQDERDLPDGKVAIRSDYMAW